MALEKKTVVKDDTVVVRVLAILDCMPVIERGDLKWHHSCYSKFIDKGKVERLRKKVSQNVNPMNAPSRCSIQLNAIKWEFCMLCQSHDVKKHTQCCYYETGRQGHKHVPTSRSYEG